MKVNRLGRIRMSLYLLVIALLLAACNNGSADSGSTGTPATATAAPAATAEPAPQPDESEPAAAEAGAQPAPAPAPVQPAAAAQADACDSGDPGAAEDPCVITSVDQLQGISAASDGHFALGADIDASASSDWNDGKGFAPIASFSGSLDGRGHQISGLVIDRPGDMNTGMFAMVQEGARIHDLTLADVEVTGGMFVGAVVGNMRGGELSQVHVRGTVTGDAWVGGLVGSLHPPAAVLESSTAGSVSAAEERVGGLVGQNGGTVSRSFSLSTVHGPSAVGGLVGRSAGTIEYSYSIVDADDEQLWVSGAHSGTDVGGLAGVVDTDAVIRDSYTVSFRDNPDSPPQAGHPVAGRTWGSGAGITGTYWGADHTGVSAHSDLRRPLDEMRLAETFEGWDFESIWTIAEGEDYPDLAANPRR